MRLSPSAPAASAARAISQMSVTFGESFTMTGTPAPALAARVAASVVSVCMPNAAPPQWMFGQEMLTSMRSTPAAVTFSARI